MAELQETMELGSARELLQNDRTEATARAAPGAVRRPAYYRPEIDGLRAIAVIPVILFHAGFTIFSGGYAGVDVFFVISGYLITRIILTEIEENRFSIVRFYERRARRILPALYTVTTITAALSCFLMTPDDLVSMAKSTISIPLFLSNVLFWSERGYFGIATEFKPLVHTWSLAVEEQFYIFFPLLILCMRNVGKKLLAATVFVVISISLFLSWYITKLHFETAFYLPMTRVWELGLGASVHFVSRKEPFNPGKLASLLMSAAGLALIGYAYLMFDAKTPFPSLNALFPVTGTLLLILGTENAPLARGVLSNSILVGIGLISYSLYLVHQPVFALARHANVFNGREILWIFLSFVLTLALFRLVESPCRNRSLVNKRTILSISIGGAALLIIAGSVLVATDGLLARYSAADQKIFIQYREVPEYNVKLFGSMNLADFEKGKKKILLVGDSHAQDMLNVVQEAGLFSKLSFSTKQINAECGNLYLPDYSAVERFIPENRRERCTFIGRYEGDRLKKLAREADEIWLVSAWPEWVIPYLPRSIRRLEADFATPVRIFGKKDFGKITRSSVIAIDSAQRPRFTQPITGVSAWIDRQMAQALHGFPRYHPLLNAMCGGDARHCSIFDSSGRLISPDGGHLTREGAVVASQRIAPILKQAAR